MKLALLIGINYRGTEAELNGCINDIDNTKEILTNIYEYKEENITVLTDDSEIKPTYDNILEQLLQISTKKDVDQIWISYSGHGTYIKDKEGDEDDGKDECLVPLDYDKKGLIEDDYLNKILAQINEKTNVIFIVDACHSETMLDLQYRYISGRKSVIENDKSEIKCNCIMISGCRDNQTSADAYGINNSKEYSGAMTSTLLLTLKKHNYTITCWRLLKQMRRFLKLSKFRQVPQICCSRKLNGTTLFSLKNYFSYM